MDACSSKALEEVALFLLENGAGSTVETTDMFGRSALTIACKLSTIRVVKKLISLGAPTDVVNEEGNTPLHCAVFLNGPDILSFLLEHTPTASLVGRVNHNGQTALMLAFHRVRYWWDQESYARALVRAKMLVAMGEACNPSATDTNGETALDMTYNIRAWAATLILLDSGIFTLTEEMSRGIAKDLTSSFSSQKPLTDEEKERLWAHIRRVVPTL